MTSGPGPAGRLSVCNRRWRVSRSLLYTGACCCSFPFLRRRADRSRVLTAQTHSEGEHKMRAAASTFVEMSYCCKTLANIRAQPDPGSSRTKFSSSVAHFPANALGLLRLLCCKMLSYFYSSRSFHSSPLAPNTRGDDYNTPVPKIRRTYAYVVCCMLQRYSC